MSLQSLSSISCYGVKYQYDGAETSTSHLWHSADSDTMDRYALLFSSHFPELKTHTHTHTHKKKRGLSWQSGGYDFTLPLHAT